MITRLSYKFPLRFAEQRINVFDTCIAGENSAPPRSQDCLIKRDFLHFLKNTKNSRDVNSCQFVTALHIIVKIHFACKYLNI